MNSQKSKTGTTVGLYKKLQKEQRDELCQLHLSYRTRTQTLWAAYKATYKKLVTQEERAVLLTTFVQTRSQFRQAHDLERKRLLAQQSRQLENLLVDLAVLTELHKRKQTRSARTVIEAAIKSGTLYIAPL